MPAVNKKFTIVRLLCAFGIAIALSVAVIFAVSEEPVTAIYNLFLGPLQSKRHFFEVFASSVPLIFTGLALGLVFKSGNFSMIADACLYTGAVVTAGACHQNISSVCSPPDRHHDRGSGSRWSDRQHPGSFESVFPHK